jgi:thiol peroxidase
MAEIQLHGNTFHTSGMLPENGSQAPDFTFTKTDLSSVSKKDFKGSKLVLNIFPSVDTPTCAASVRAFNEKASALPGTKVLCVSKDLPFALSRFCGAEGLNEVIPVSDFRGHTFARDYGVGIEDGPLEGLHARAVVVLDEDGKVIHRQLVENVADEPNYEAAISALKGM